MVLVRTYTAKVRIRCSAIGQNNSDFLGAKMNRHFIFRNYWWLALLGIALAVSLILFFYKDGRMPLIGSVLATFLAFCYFIQQQRLAEISLFKTLFTEFNARYDSLNGHLSSTLSVHPDLTDEQRDKIVDYFNLYGEEYLFFKEGYIHADVWQSWCRGMLYYMEKEPFSSLWCAEQRTSSYYGLSLEVIRKGARY